MSASAGHGTSLGHHKGAQTMRAGTVKWFHETRGFGFIRPYDESSDVFVHMDTVRKAGMLVLTEGQKLRFDIGEHKGRRAAVNLQPTP
jgi:CspA family cold shock protein